MHVQWNKFNKNELIVNMYIYLNLALIRLQIRINYNLALIRLRWFDNKFSFDLLLFLLIYLEDIRLGIINQFLCFGNIRETILMKVNHDLIKHQRKRVRCHYL